MEASLDTNVIIHLYSVGLQEILFRRFSKVKVFEFIRKQELNRHADSEILRQFDVDVSEGKIELITEAYLGSIGMLTVFRTHVEETRILYNGSDLGEAYAISIARTLGCVCLVTDDIKERGPHYTLMRTPDSDVMPFSSYELFFLDYLESIIEEAELIHKITTVCSASSYIMNIDSKLKGFIRRFWMNPYSASEKEWMRVFCLEKGINAKKRLETLNSFMKNSHPK